jgi:hypothetical protein
MRPTAVFAQGAIGGAVRDASGAVLPGVTVDATSPALIQRLRTAVTDGNGRYLIVDLQPGVYSVTFTLSGFATLKREGLELSAGMTLPINAELKVAELAEPIIVTGATPVVDVQNTRQQVVMTRAVLDVLPRTRQQVATGHLIPGISVPVGQVDVGGSLITPPARLITHGSNSADQTWAIDGMKVTEGDSGAQRALIIGDNAVQEYTYETSAHSAEFPQGGVRMNLVPKDGSNSFRGTIYGDFTTEGMVGSHLNAELKARGLTSTTRVREIWDLSPAFGGPLRKDRLWFYTSYRNWGNAKNPPGAFYLSDPTRPAVEDGRWWDANGRLTWQATLRNKFTLFHEYEEWDLVHFAVSSQAPPEVSSRIAIRPIRFTQAKWSSPITNRVLLEAGGYHFWQVHNTGPSPESRLSSWVPEPDDLSAWPTFEISTGQWTAGTIVDSRIRPSTRNASWWGQSGSLSYVTGSNNLKVGFTHVQGYYFFFFPTVPPVLRMLNGQPLQVQLIAKPAEVRDRLKRELGLYAHNQFVALSISLSWTVPPIPAPHAGPDQ